MLLAQINTCVGDLDGNAAKILELSRTAARKLGYRPLFPEMAVTGYPIEDLAFHNTFPQSRRCSSREYSRSLKEEGLEQPPSSGLVGTNAAAGKPQRAAGYP